MLTVVMRCGRLRGTPCQWLRIRTPRWGLPHLCTVYRLWGTAGALNVDANNPVDGCIQRRTVNCKPGIDSGQRAVRGEL